MSADKTPLPDYFALLQSMTGGLGSANPFAGFVTTDPAELDRKIRELEVVQMWLSAQSSAIELSIGTMRMQRDALAQWKTWQADTGGASSDTAPASSPTADALAQMAHMVGAMNPSQWMAAFESAAPKRSPARAPRQPRSPAAAGKARKPAKPRKT